MAFLNTMKKILSWKEKKESNDLSHVTLPPTLGQDQITTAQEAVKSEAMNLLYAGEKNRRGTSLDSVIQRNKYALDRKDEKIEELEINLKKQSKSAQLIMAVSIAVWGLLWWTWATLYWQLSPESSVQSWISDLGKKLSDQKTWYELIQEGKIHIVTLAKQSDELRNAISSNKINKEMIELYKELTIINNGRIKAFEEREASYEREKPSPTRSWKIAQFWGIKPIIGWNSKALIPKSINTSNAHSYIIVSKVRSEVMADFPNKNINIRIQEQIWGRILVWLEYQGERSLGFYADSLKFQNRLTTWWMNAWVEDSLHQLSVVKQLKLLWSSRGINDKGSISMIIKSKYNGDVQFTVKDNFSKKTRKSIVGKEDNILNISGELDDMLKDFIS